MKVNSLGYSFNVNNNATKMAFKGAADDTASPPEIQNAGLKQNNNKKKLSVLDYIFGGIFLLGLGTYGTSVFLSKVKAKKNMEIISEKLSEAAKTELEKALNNYGGDRKFTLIQELVSHKTLQEEPPQKIKDLVTKIAEDKKIKTNKQQGFWKDRFWDGVMDAATGLMDFFGL